MRGSKAKSLRGLAGVGKGESQHRAYAALPHTIRIKQAKDVLGNVIAQVRTGTLMLDPTKGSSARALYKTLKHGYKTGRMNPSYGA